MTDDRQKHKGGDAPEIELRDGALRAVAWRTDGEYGPFFNTKLSRYYQDSEGQVRETATLRDGDLLQASALLGEMHRTVRDRKREHTQSHDREQSPQRRRQRSRDER